MITVTGDVAAAQAELRRLAAAVDRDHDATIEQGLDALIARMQPATPVRTGRMKAGYEAEVHSGVGLLSDTQDYAHYVVFGTRHQRPNEALNAVLDSAERELADVYELALTRLAARYS